MGRTATREASSCRMGIAKCVLQSRCQGVEGEIVATMTEAVFEHGLQAQARRHVFGSSRKGHGKSLIDPNWQIHQSRPHMHGKSVHEGLEIVGSSLVNSYTSSLSPDFNRETNPRRRPNLF